MSTLGTRLRGLAATLALAAFVVGTPLALVAIGAVPSPSAFSWSRLTAPDDGTMALEVIALIAWLGWAVFTYSVLAAVLAHARGIRAPRIRGLDMPQLAADRLVAIAALLFVAIPTAGTVLPHPRADAAVAARPIPLALERTVSMSMSVSAPVAAELAIEKRSNGPETESYTVKRGDSLWRIAEERLGDGTRYVELVDLNHAVLHGHPDFLLPGTVLRVPTADTNPDGQYVVQPGDTLSEIAEDELGDASAYPAIVDASRDTEQPNGAYLTDPDLILPGWKLTMPFPKTHGQQSGPGQVHPPDVEPDVEQEAVPGLAPPVQTDAPTSVPEAAEPAPPSADEQDDDTHSWLLPGLAGSGAVLGAAVWLVLRAQRRTQLRHRLPGTIIAPPPPALIPAEMSSRLAASAVAPKILTLDAALRSLDPLPRLLTAKLGDTRIELTLAEASPPPPPWAGSGTSWRIALADVPERPEDSFPPYPLLVSIGRTEGGSFVLLNLEELRTVTVTGEDQRKASFARHLAAELAVNPWAVVTRVDVLGLGSDLASFNLGRVHTHPAGDTEFIAQLARELASAAGQVEPDDFRAALIATASRPESELDELAKAIHSVQGRAAAALVDLCGEPGHATTHLELDADGHLRVEDLGLDVLAAGLSEEEARACALLLDLTLEEDVIPVPDPADAASVSNLAGALVERLTAPRPDGPAGEGSLLPLDTHVYAKVAATTEADLATVAPVARPAAVQQAQIADPDLDEDLARWESPIPVAPKLTLLGPVAARTLGDAKATASRRPYFVELLAYLALHPRGTTADHLATALGIRPKKARGDLSALRLWLGADRDGTQFLPPAHQTHEPGMAATYQLHGVLCDLDLFRRLRTRGQSRGAAGIADLVDALCLVSGEPFTNLRPNGWGWLLEGDRHDHIMTSAIVDVGHIITAHALANADLELAKFAAGTALAAAPYDEIAQLDMVQVEHASGDLAGADVRLREEVCERRDDDMPPIDLPARSAKIAEDKAWLPSPLPGRTHPRRTG